MSRFVVTAFIVLLGLTTVLPHAASAGECRLEFPELRGRFSVVMVRMTVDALAAADSSGYVEAYENGDSWACILMILDGLAVAEDDSIVPSRARVKGTEYEDAWKIWAYHGQLRWTGWRDLVRALLGEQRSVDWGSENCCIGGDVLAEVQRSFEDVMAPGASEEVLAGVRLGKVEVPR